MLLGLSSGIAVLVSTEPATDTSWKPNLDAAVFPFVSFLTLVLAWWLQARFADADAALLTKPWFRDVADEAARNEKAEQASRDIKERFAKVADRIQLIIVLITLLPGLFTLFASIGWAELVMTATLLTVCTLLATVPISQAVSPKTIIRFPSSGPIPEVSNTTAVTAIILLVLTAAALFLPMEFHGW